MFWGFMRSLACLLAATLPANPNLSAQSGHPQDQDPAAAPEFHGTYEELNPTQKKLIDEWYADYNRMTHDNSQPTDYNQFAMSTRTTFEAVTHALMTTELTDKSGR